MKGLRLGYALEGVSFSYHRCCPKHLSFSVTLLKQQDINPHTLVSFLRRTVTPENVKLKNTEFTVQFYDETTTWASSDYRTINLKDIYTEEVQKVGITAGLFVKNIPEEHLWEELRDAGYVGKDALTLCFTHLVDGSDKEDKLFWLINDPQCMNEPPRFDHRAAEVRKRVGKYCQRKLTDRELSPYVARAMEKQLDFIDPLTGQRAAWYQEIITCLKEWRGILEYPIALREWSKIFYMSSYFAKYYDEEVAAWVAAGGDELLK